MTIELTRDQFCALLMGAGYAVGAMHRDKCAVQGTMDWIAEAADALRREMMKQDPDLEPTDVKGPNT